jgi:hypothetical protein
MIAFLITNVLDIGIWTTNRLLHAVYYSIYGDVEKYKLKLELQEIRKELLSIHKKIDTII